jgi:hypothetical protein
MRKQIGLLRKRGLGKWAILPGLMLCTMPLAMCTTLSTVTQTSTICAPFNYINYASKTKTSLRYAGPQLVPDLRAHNFTMQRLGCKPR